MRIYLMLLSLIVIVTGYLAFLISVSNNCHTIEYQNQQQTKHIIVCERTNK